MKTAPLKAADNIAAVLAELQTKDGKTLNRCMTASEAARHIGEKYLKQLTNGADRQTALNAAKQRIVSFNNGTNQQWRMFCPPAV